MLCGPSTAYTANAFCVYSDSPLGREYMVFRAPSVVYVNGEIGLVGLGRWIPGREIPLFVRKRV